MTHNQVLVSSVNQAPSINISLGNAAKALATFAGNLATSSQPTPITLTFNNITKVLSVPAKLIDPSSKERTIKRTLLNNISGQIHPKQLVALMGPSGSGKTTLLNTLSGRAMSGVTGQVYFNQQLYNKSMKRKLAYVLQQDTFFERLTVRQQLTYTALLRLPNHFSRADKHAQVDNIIEQLRLQKCANTPIMLVSGGEKKRVNIGTELLTDPTVIFLDEPTSGLDSTTAFDLIEMLREVAMEGKTIITSIHQPSSQIFQSFDQLFLLADGQTIFMGRPFDALPYFRSLGHECPAQYNPADYIMDLVNRDVKVREELIQAYLNHRRIENVKLADETGEETDCSKYLTAEPAFDAINQAVTKEENSKESDEEDKWPIGFLAQTFILFTRSFYLTGKAQFTLLDIIQCVLVAVVTGICWFRIDRTEESLEDRSGFLFFLITFWIFKTMMGGLFSFPPEKKVLRKERASGSYRLSAYFMGKSLAEGPLKLVLPTIFFIIAYWMADVSRNPGIFFGILGFLLLTVLVAESFGLMLGAALRDLQHALTAATVVVIASMLLGGFYVQNIPLWLSVWAPWLSFFRYPYHAALQLQFMGSETYQCSDGTFIEYCLNNSNGTFTGAEALKYFKIDLHVGFNFLIEFGMFLVFRLIAYLSLRFIRNTDGRT